MYCSGYNQHFNATPYPSCTLIYTVIYLYVDIKMLDGIKAQALLSAYLV